MKSIFNSHHILLKALLALALCLVSGSAWGTSKTYYAYIKATFQSGKGTVYNVIDSKDNVLNNDNQAINSNSSTNNSVNVSVVLRAVPNNGYKFIPWTLDSDAQNSLDNTYTTSSNPIKFTKSSSSTDSPGVKIGEISANFDATEYNILYNPKGGTVNPASDKYNIESTSTLATPTRNGYTFTGWKVISVTKADTDTNLNNCGWVVGEVPTTTSLKDKFGNVSLEAQWTPTTYYVTLIPDDGTLIGTSETTFSYNIEGNGSGNISTLPKVERTGYNFAGWKVTSEDKFGWSNHTPSAVDNEMSVNGKWGDVTLTAQWTPNYTIKYYDGETEQTELEPKSYTIESDDALPSMTKDGYTFVGWKPKDTVGGWISTETYPAGTNLGGKYGDVYLVAQWTPTTYYVTLIPDDGTLIGTSETTFSYNIEGNGSGNISTLPKVERAGYSFAGWEVTSPDKYGWSNHNPGAEDNEMSVVGKWGDVTLTALWEPIPGYIKITVSGLMKNDSAVFEISYGDQHVVVSLNSSNAGGLVVKIPDVGEEGKQVTVTPKSWPKNYKEVSTSPVEKTVYTSHDIDNSLLYEFSVGNRISNIFETVREF